MRYSSALSININIETTDIFTMKYKITTLILLLSISLAVHAAPASRQEIVQKLFRSIEEWMGTPYKLGGSTKSGIDCSAFVLKVYKKVFNRDLPRTVAEQKLLGRFVSRKELQPGDLLFFNINGKVGHIGIYVFDNKFIHAASSGPTVGVIKSSLKESYYNTRFVYAKRILDLPPYSNATPKMVKKESVKNSKLDVVIGKILYEGSIYQESEGFIEKQPIFIEIKNLSQSVGSFTLKIEHIEKNIVRESSIKAGYKQKSYKKLILMKGNYSITIYSPDKQLLYKKEIKVL